MLEGWHGRPALCVRDRDRDREISKCPQALSALLRKN